MRVLESTENIKNWINNELSRQGHFDCQAGAIYRLDELDINGSNWSSQQFIGIKELFNVYLNVVEMARDKFNLAD